MFRFIFYFLNLSIILMLVLLFASNKGIGKNDKLKNKIVRLDDNYSSLNKRKEDLEKNIKLFKENRSYQKHIIRKEMGFIEENDVIYIFNKKWQL